MSFFETTIRLPADVDADQDVEIVVEVEYSIYGGYRPATWGYYGGEPAEYPEVEIESIVVVDDPASDWEDESIPLGPMPEGLEISHLLKCEQIRQLEAEALEAAREYSY